MAGFPVPAPVNPEDAARLMDAGTAINVQAYGAVPDGDLSGGGTDNTAAFQAAVDAALAAGKDLYIPTCNGPVTGALKAYTITDEIDVYQPHSGFRIFGDGPLNSLIVQKTASKNGFNITPNTQHVGLRLENFGVKGLYGNRTGKGLNIPKNVSGQMSGLHVRGVHSMNFAYGCYVEFIDQSTVMNCEFSNNTYGLYFTDAVNGLTISGCALNGNDNCGLRFSTARGILITGNDLGGTGNSGAGCIIWLTGNQNVVDIIGNSFEIWTANVSVVKMEPTDALARLVFMGNNVVCAGSGASQAAPCVNINNGGASYVAQVLFQNNLLQGYAAATPGVKYLQGYTSDTVLPITGTPPIGGHLVTQHSNSVHVGSKKFQIGNFPFSDGVGPKNEDEYCDGHIAWFARDAAAQHPWTGQYLEADLQAAFSGYTGGGSVVYHRSSLLNYHIINALKKWSTDYPITAASTLVQVATALEALQDTHIPYMDPYMGT